MTIKLTRRSTGSYEYKMYGHTFVIARNDDGASSWYNKWAIIDENTNSGTGAIPTLADCRKALNDMKTNPEQYGMKSTIISGK